MLGKQLTQAAAGSAAGEGLYVDDVFSTYVYEGSGATRNITNDIDLAGEGGLVWIKRRDGTHGHKLTDTERGATKALESYDTTVEVTDSNGVTAFNSDGFSLGTTAHYNGSTLEMCSWTFRKAPGFFDVVTYTGNDAASHSVAHNLGSVPGMIVVKDLGTNSWYVYHKSSGAGKYGVLNSTAAFASSTVIWGNTAPTSTHFYVGSSGGGTAVNGNGRTYVAYIFAHDDQLFGENEDESIIKCGSYTGNGSTQEINLGWEPQWVLIKSSAGTTTNWHVFDNMREINAGGNDPALFTDNSNAENSSNDYFGQLTATGFELTSTLNGSGNTYVYMAIRRPHKPPTAATEVFTPQATRGATDGTPSELGFTAGFPVDLLLYTVRAGGSNSHAVLDRIRGGEKLLATASEAAETSSDHRFDSNEGIFSDSSWTATNNYGGLLFRRAPGFFDVVAYEGTGSVRTVAHNLGVAPELMLVCRRTGLGFITYSADYGPSGYSVLNGNYAFDTSYWGSGSGMWNNTDPTSSVFTVGTNNAINYSGADFIAYLFATLSGISKVGSYTGTGSDINVDCGFTSGARFVMIKRTDSSGDWYVWDSARGINAGNDPYILFNSSAAEVTSTDYIDPLNAGFTVTSTAPAGLNASGGTYLFLAIA